MATRVHPVREWFSPQAKWLGHEQEGVKITRWDTANSFKAHIHAPIASSEARRRKYFYGM